MRVYKCLVTWKCPKIWWIDLKKDHYRLIGGQHCNFFERMCERRVELVVDILVGGSYKTNKGNLNFKQLSSYLQLLELKQATNHQSVVDAMEVLKISKLGVK